MFSSEILKRREAVLRCWPSFLSDTPRQVGEVIDRNETQLPHDFVAWAPAIVTASKHLLGAAGYGPVLWDRPEGWSDHRHGAGFSKPTRNERNIPCLLRVRQIGRFCTIETDLLEALVFTFGSLPIVTRSPHAAMRLAEYCSPRPHQAADGLSWVISEPCGIRWC